MSPSAPSRSSVEAALADNAHELHTMIVFRRAEKALRQREYPVLRAHGLTPAQFGVLDVLRAKGPLKVGDIIEATFATSGNMTVVIRNMERDGLIAVKPAPDDARARLVELTEAGRGVIDSALADHARNVGQLMSVLTHSEREELMALLRKFRALESTEEEE